jgi:hypothetical protein
MLWFLFPAMLNVIKIPGAKCGQKDWDSYNLQQNIDFQTTRLRMIVALLDILDSTCRWKTQ